jgi:hypothetical protein
MDLTLNFISDIFWRTWQNAQEMQRLGDSREFQKEFPYNEVCVKQLVEQPWHPGTGIDKVKRIPFLP